MSNNKLKWCQECKHHVSNHAYEPGQQDRGPLACSVPGCECMKFVRAVVAVHTFEPTVTPPQKTVFIATVQQRCEDGKRRVRERFESEDKRALLERVFSLLSEPDFAVTIMRKR